MAANKITWVNASGSFEEPPWTLEVTVRFLSIISLLAGLNDEVVGRFVVEV